MIEVNDSGHENDELNSSLEKKLDFSINYEVETMVIEEKLPNNNIANYSDDYCETYIILTN